MNLDRRSDLFNVDSLADPHPFTYATTTVEPVDAEMVLKLVTPHGGR